MPLHEGHQGDRRLSVNPLFSEADPLGALEVAPPAHRLPDGPMPPSVAYRLVHDELMLDGNARLNLATFVTTWMEPQATALMAECADKNMIDKDEYPQTAELERRCVAILADLWNAPDPQAAVGCSTTGSSEACMLGGLALKRRWMRNPRNADRYASGQARPNLVMGINVQVCWEKFCNFWEVEPRLVPMEGERFHLDGRDRGGAVRREHHRRGGDARLDHGRQLRAGAEICAALDALQERTGLDIPVHVDGASGAMVAPFLDPELVWDFRLPRVASINTSGHKYGLVYPGVGWALWRDTEALPEELVFKVNYLGGDMPTFALNFSRPGAEVVAQYYTFLRLGRDGYRAVQQAARDVAEHIADGIEASGAFRLLTARRPIAGLRVHDPRRGEGVRRLRRLAAAARARLAGAGVHIPGEPRGPGGHPSGVPQRILQGPGRPLTCRPQPPATRTPPAAGADERARRGEPHRLPPLSLTLTPALKPALTLTPTR